MNNGKLGDFFNFKTMITEKVVKWAFIMTIILMCIAAVVTIFGSFADGIKMMDWNATGGLYRIFVKPILTLVVLVFGFVFVRIAYEAIVVWFRIYDEIKQLNEKKKPE